MKLPTPAVCAGVSPFLGTPVPRWPNPESVPPTLCVGVGGTRYPPAPEDPPLTPDDKQPAFARPLGQLSSFF